MSANLLAAATRMYEVLKLWPCACGHKWKRDERVLAYKCLRCRATERWEEIRGAPDTSLYVIRTAVVVEKFEGFTLIGPFLDRNEAETYVVGAPALGVVERACGAIEREDRVPVTCHFLYSIEKLNSSTRRLGLEEGAK